MTTSTPDLTLLEGSIDSSRLQEVHSVSVDEGSQCGGCNYRCHEFFQVGIEPDPHSNDPAENGLCGGCFAHMLAGNGPFQDTGFRAINAEDVGLEYPIISVQVHALKLPDDDAERAALQNDFTKLMENALSSFPESEFGVELGHVETGILGGDT